MGLRSVLAVTLVVLSLAACSGTVQPPPATSPLTSDSAATPSPSAIASGTITQNLVFTGPAAGTLTSATTSCQDFVASTQLNIFLKGSLNGQDLTFNIQVNSGYTGPGDYPVGSTLDEAAANLRLQVGSYQGSSASGGGTMVVNPDGKSGSLKANLSGDEHVEGAFACDQLVTS